MLKLSEIYCLIVVDVLAIIYSTGIIWLRYLSIIIVTLIYFDLIKRKLIRNKIIDVCKKYNYDFCLLSNDKYVLRGTKSIVVLDKFFNICIVSNGNIIVSSYNNFCLITGEMLLRDDKVYTLKRQKDIYEAKGVLAKIIFERSTEKQIFSNLTLGDVLVINRRVCVDYSFSVCGGAIISNHKYGNHIHIEIMINEKECTLSFDYDDVVFDFSIYKIRPKDIYLDRALKKPNAVLYDENLRYFDRIRYTRNYNEYSYIGKECRSDVICYKNGFINPINVYVDDDLIKVFVDNEVISIEQREEYIKVLNNSEVFINVDGFNKYFKRNEMAEFVYIKNNASPYDIQKSIYNQLALYEIKYEDEVINKLWQNIGKDDDYLSSLMVLRLMLYFDNEKENVISLLFRYCDKCLYKQLLTYIVVLEYIKTSERYELFDISIGGYTLNQLVYKVSDKASEICLKDNNYDLALNTIYLIDIYLELINTIEDKLDLIEIKQAIVNKYRIIKKINFSSMLLMKSGVTCFDNDYIGLLQNMKNDKDMNQFVASIILYDYFVNVVGVKKKNDEIKIKPSNKNNDNKTVISKINNSFVNINVIRSDEDKVLINGELSHTSAIKLEENKEKYIEVYCQY